MLRCTNSAGVTRGSDATLCFSTSPPSSVGSVVRRQRWDSLSAGHRPRWRPLAQRRGRPREVDLRCSQTCVRVSHGKMAQWHNGAPLHTHLTSSVCRGIISYTSYSRTNYCIYNGYDNINLEPNAMNNIDTVAHMNMHYTQY